MATAGENPARWRGHLGHLLEKAKGLKRGHHKAVPWHFAGLGAPELERQVASMHRKDRKLLMGVLVDFGALREHLAALNAVVGVAFDRVGVAALELDKSRARAPAQTALAAAGARDANRPGDGGAGPILKHSLPSHHSAHHFFRV